MSYSSKDITFKFVATYVFNFMSNMIFDRFGLNVLNSVSAASSVHYIAYVLAEIQKEQQQQQSTPAHVTSAAKGGGDNSLTSLLELPTDETIQSGPRLTQAEVESAMKQVRSVHNYSKIPYMRTSNN